MGAIFISHASQDNTAAERLSAHLAAAGHQSIFLDFDPARGIPPGRNWEQELYGALRACRAAVILCSGHSMASDWCFAEITHARALGKAVIPVKIAPCELKPVLTDLQAIDLTTDPEEGYRRLAMGLRAAGLDSRDTFEWDASRPPYPGLLAFQEADAGIFFGRDGEIHGGLDALNRVQRFGGARLMLFVGASGSGKSSLVRAGIVPRLRRDPQRWLVIPPFRARKDPFEELAIALAEMGKSYAGWPPQQSIRDRLGDGGGSSSPTVLLELLQHARRQSGERDALALLVIDQLEELLVEVSPDRATRFCALIRSALLAPDAGLIAIATLRSDFIGDFQTHSPLRDVPYESISVGRLQPPAFAQVVEGPAALAGIDLEAGFVQAIVYDTETDDALPLLAFTLRQLWDRFGSSRRFGLREYREELGGLEGSVRDAAEAVIQAQPISEIELAALRRALLALVRIDEQGHYTRRPVPWGELPSACHAIVERFIEARLLVASGDDAGRSVEVSHEALFRSWDRLRDWLEEDREFLQWRRRLRTSLTAWRNAAMDDEVLLRGVTLAEAEGQLERRSGDLSTQDRDFIRQSVHRRERERGARRRRNRLIGAGLGALSLLSLLFGWYAYERSREADHARSIAEAETGRAESALAEAETARDHAEQQTDKAAQERNRAESALQEASAARARAERERRTAVARQLTSQARAHVGDRLDLALLLSLEANRLAPSRDAQSVLLEALQSADFLQTYLVRHQFPVTCLAFSPDGQTLATGSRDYSVILWDVAEGKPRQRRLRGHTNWVQSVAFSPDGTLLASTSDDGTIRLWDGRDGRSRGEPLFGHKGSVLDVAFSPDGRLLATAGRYGTVRLWDTDSWQPLETASVSAKFITGLAFHPGGAELAVTGPDSDLMVLGVPSLAPRYRLGQEGSGGGWDVDFSPDGLSLASTGGKDVLLWDVATRALRYPPFKNVSEWGVKSVDFSPDGEDLLASTNEGRLFVWRVGTGKPYGATAPRHTGEVNAVAFSPGGELFASAGDDGSIVLGRTRPSGRLLRSLARPSRRIYSLALSPSGQVVAAGTDGGKVHLLQASTGTSLGILQGAHTGRVGVLDFSRTGRRLASGSENGTVTVWEMASRRPLGPPLQGHTGEVRSLAFGADQGTLVSGSVNGQVLLWNVDKAALRIDPIIVGSGGRPSAIYAVDVSPDGRTFAHAAGRGSVILREFDFGERLGKALTDHNRNVIMTLAFSPDGRTLATGTLDNRVALWDLETGRLRGGPLAGHTGAVMSLGFGPHGQRLVTAGQDAMVILWDVASQQPIGRLAGHAGGVRSVVFSPDGETVLSGSFDGELLAWNVSVESWRRAACAVANRNLDYQEWRSFLGSEPYRKTCPQRPGPDDPDTAANLAEVARITSNAGDFDEAESLARRALEMRERVLGPDHPSVVSSLQDLGSIYFAQARFAPAVVVLERALGMHQRLALTDHAELINILNGLGLAHYKLGNSGTAEPLYRRALDLADRHLPADHELVPTLRVNFGRLLLDADRFDAAQDELDRALALDEARLGVDAPALLFVLRNIGLLHQRKGETAEAERVYRRALAVWSPVRFEGADVEEAMVHAGLGALYLGQGRLDEAEPLLEQALHVRERMLDRHHPDLIESLQRYAELLRARGRNEDALRYEARVRRARPGKSVEPGSSPLTPPPHR